MSAAETALAACQGRLRILIVGAGIAGTALAALLRRWDIGAAIVERAAPSIVAGYNLGIYPVGGRVMHGLGLYPAYEAASEAIHTYQVFNGAGQKMQECDLGALFDSYGPIAGIRRAELLQLLRGPLGENPIIHSTTITGLEQTTKDVGVTFSDGSLGRFDLVVGADGIHSAIRSMILPAEKIHTFDTKWACLVSWLPGDVLPGGVFREYWGAGFLVGLYAVKDGIGVIAAGPRERLEKNRAAFLAQASGHLNEPVATRALDAVAADTHPFLWQLLDMRADTWTAGRVVLVGDAADAFLPTAGVGASMALLSAAALADELSRADAAHLPGALGLYQRRQQPKVLAAQNNSRKLAHLLMINSPTMAWGREVLMHFYSPDRALQDIVKVMDGLV